MTGESCFAQSPDFCLRTQPATTLAGLVPARQRKRVLTQAWAAHLLFANGTTERTGTLTPVGCDDRAFHTLPLQSGARPQWPTGSAVRLREYGQECGQDCHHPSPQRPQLQSFGRRTCHRTRDIRIQIPPAPSDCSHVQIMQICRQFSGHRECRRRDSNPRHADYDSDRLPSGGGRLGPSWTVCWAVLSAGVHELACPVSWARRGQRRVRLYV